MKLQKKVEQIAKTCYEVNKAYCESLGVPSQPSWENAADWQKSSVINGVKNIIDGVVKTPEDSHESWVDELKRTGWIYGKVRDTKKKTHPCMVAYNELPKEQRVKDRLFVATVQSFFTLFLTL